jgi:Smg protein
MVMKQSVVDVLMFLFERYIGEDNESMDERDHMHTRLEEVGFQDQHIDQAFDWLEDLATIREKQELIPVKTVSMRIFCEEEKAVLNEDCLGFIMYLEQAGILSSETRELILDRVIALDNELSIEQLKWIVMIVLHTHPGEENAYAWMESLVFDEAVDYMQ